MSYAHAGIDGDDAEYLAFCEEFGRRHADKAEYEMRRQTFSTHKALIKDSNASNRTYKLAINKYADWTQVRATTLLMPRTNCYSLPDPSFY